jgi:MYXO-CTERM domain-containing protein
VWSLDAGSRDASAYTIESMLTPGCHEPITSQALRTVRTELATAAPLTPTANDRALVDDVQFTLEPDMEDLGGATLIVSARDNDLKGLSSDDLSYLSEVHGNPANQDEHCLRNGNQEEPGGSEAAVLACRAFIRTRIEEALDGLDAKGRPDPARRSPLRLELSLRGNVTAQLPTYYVHMGHALHAVEDSFTHTYRTPDGMKITVVMNWVKVAKGKLVESRDGPPHAAKLDVCNDPDDLRRTRRALATAAATELLRATLDPLKSRDEKMAAVDVALDTYLSYSPGCTFDNDWCDAAERQYRDAAGCSCTAGTDGPAAGAGLLGLFVALLIVANRSRMRL